MAGRIDRRAVAAIREERIDWRFKGMPPSLTGMTIAEALAARPDLFREGFLPPVMTIDAGALEHNLATMAAWCAGRGLAHAPHGKTTMAPQLFARQFDHGAWGLTCATASQLRVYRAFGVSPVMLANELVDETALAWVAGELARDETFEFSCWVDSVAGVARMTEALRGVSRPVDVLVELGFPGGRTGARGRPAAAGVAEAVAASPALRLVGVGGYEGAVTHDTHPEALDAVRAYLSDLRALTVELADRGLFGAERVIVTAGGSAYYDVVAEVLGAPWPDGLSVLPVVRGGAYLTHDSGLYARQSPLGRHPRLDDAPPLRPALRAWAQVNSAPEPGLALLAAGKRDLPYDIDLPTPEVLRRDGATVPLDAEVFSVNDQHAFVRHDKLEVGDWVGLGVSHPCTTFDKWALIPVVDGETVVDLVRTYF
ncbi:amino acid deaminase [Actinophytocola gossypii]|uniref:Amino acid deaminase n=1 Tax=Actinophytocola gossypii TaxID=2812003 RepID=A0ABT2J8Q8_9PSEU|nr:amino acid deaminase [Actinophytocola gossypii]MCT2583840.1 amino acid deaminase [Actinophytocola gossypii]